MFDGGDKIDISEHQMSLLDTQQLHLHANNAKKLFRETSVRCQDRSQAEKIKGHPVNPGLCFRDQLRPDFKMR